jgi:streptogramin lyase
VARGAAAPEGAPREPGLAGELPTLSHPATAPTVVRRRGRSRLAWLLAAVVAAATGLALTAPWEDGGGGPAQKGSTARAGPAPRPTPTPAGPRKGQVIERVGSRPNGIAVAGGDVWVSSYERSLLTRLDAENGRERAAHPRAALGALDLVGGAGSLWEAAFEDRVILRLNPRSGRVVARLGLPVAPVALAVGDRELWVAGPDAVLHYDIRGRYLGRIPVSEGVAAIVLGDEALYIATLRVPHLLRFDLDTGVTQTWTDFRTPAFALAFGAGYVWASLRDADTVIRVQPRSGKTVTTATPRQPEQLVVAGGHVYVACSADHAVVAFDPETMRRWGRAVAIRFNPYAIAEGEGHVWVTDVGANAVTRVDY